MPRLIWSPAALRDVARLHGFLKPKNPDAASRAVKAIRQGVRLLGTHPQAGRPAEDMPPEFREWPVGFGSGSYLVMYRYDGRDVVLLAVRHEREAGY
ncbi:plasmid stabilization protein [Aliidongia dinghuensis]|uniref:Plasmid stabilization protein n=1 Tax=Aliidongia dinghuensis TaxID=1867774 RepID=A0A8J2YTE8_9PROT|nr:type II toxin-antitoxin system RelE/ParE family toxin [Aliidongia dinghuensis]GGF13922.1 plasmid stabilization protein [Aliidongia dinghuensis]